MEPPQSQPVPQTTTAPPPSHYSDSANSSPRSRSNETWDNTAVGAEHLALPSKLRLMCSYGGHIVPRPHDKSLCYVGGETRIVVVDRHISSLSSLTAHLSKSLLNNSSFTLKYQLPNEDLDSLITVSTDEDLENMIDEHDRALSNPSLKQSRLRLFLFPLKLESAQSNIGPILDSSTKSDDWFLTALNRGFSDSAPVNSLLNLDDDITPSQGNSADSSGCTRDEKGARQDVHSVPDSPMLDTTSSFGSTSSSPSIMNVPSIQMRVEESCGQKLGIEDQFANMVMATGDGQKNDGNLLVLASQPPPLPSALPIPSSGVVTSVEFGNRAVSDDERSDHGVPIAYRRMVQVQQQQPQNQAAMQSQQKSTGVLDLTSPDSVSSDNSFTSAVSCPKPASAMYQDQVVQVSPALNMNMVQNNPLDPNTMQIQQQQHMGEAAGYVMQTQVVNHRQPQQQPQQQQYIQSGTPQYVHQHHPVTAYYSVYPPQQQHHLQNHPPLDQQQYPFYYMPVAQPQTQHYNLTDSSQTQNYHHSQAPPSSATMVHQPPTSYNNPMVRTSAASSGKPEMYRVATAGGGGLPQLVQMPPSSQQQQFVGYSQLHHHPSQSTAPTAGATYGYDYANAAAAPSQMYYMQQQTMPSQYQTLAAGLVLPESSNQLPTETVKQQQNRTSQPL